VRVGFGVDVHAFNEEPPLLLGGVVVDETRGVDATSDGDVAIHALIDALLGAGALGDLGMHFPSSDPQWHSASSSDLLQASLGLLAGAGFVPSQVDITVIAQRVKVGPHRAAIRSSLADLLDLPLDAVSVKATTTDHLGFLGADQGIAATAIAVVCRSTAGD
jgi:2-C-methyl-D-erythritol 2,4-cyclodiphosphate synthase